MSTSAKRPRDTAEVEEQSQSQSKRQNQFQTKNKVGSNLKDKVNSDQQLEQGQKDLSIRGCYIF